MISRCSLKADCKNAMRPLHFIDDSAAKCPKLVSVGPSPAAIPVKVETKVSYLRSREEKFNAEGQIIAKKAYEILQRFTNLSYFSKIYESFIFFKDL